MLSAHLKPNLQIKNQKFLLHDKGISDTHVGGGVSDYIYSWENWESYNNPYESPPWYTNRHCNSFGNVIGSQDGTQLGAYFLLQYQHPMLTDHVASLLPQPSSKLFLSVKLAVCDITGSYHGPNVKILGPTQFPSFPSLFSRSVKGRTNDTDCSQAKRR